MSLAVSPGGVGLIVRTAPARRRHQLIAGTIRPDSGKIRMDGEDVTRLLNHCGWRDRTGYFNWYAAIEDAPDATVMAAVSTARRARASDAGCEAAGFLGELNLLTKADRRSIN